MREQTIRPAAVAGHSGCGGGYGSEAETSPCGCGDCLSGNATGRLRPRWFGGQLVGPEDLAQTGVWLMERMRRHNRLLHGWGVACGAMVTTVPYEDGGQSPWLLDVSPGYILGPFGDEVVIDRSLRVDVREAIPAGTDGCPPPADPWCAPLRGRREPGRTYYLAVRYDECLTAPVSTVGCGCGDAACEYSRVREGFRLAVLDTLPDAYKLLDDYARRETLGCSPQIEESGTRSCPQCPTSPWVVLADFTATANGTMRVDPLLHRRFVASFGGYGHFCGQPTERHPMAEWSDITRQAAADAFDDAQREEVLTAPTPGAVLAMPARTLRGIADTEALADLIGDRTVVDLAQSDSDAFTAAAQAAGVPADTTRLALARARLIHRLVKD